MIFDGNRCNPFIRHVGKAKHKAGWLEAERIIYDHQLVVFESGVFIFTIEDDEYRINAPSYIIIPPNKKHVTQALESGIRRWVHFDWAYVMGRQLHPLLSYSPEPVSTKDIIDTPNFVDQSFIKGDIKKLIPIKQTHEIMLTRWSSPSDLSAKGAFINLLEYILNPSPQKNEQHVYVQRLHNIKQDIDEECLKPIRKMKAMVDIVENQGQSYAHLCRSFKQYFGFSPHQYSTLVRIEKAKSLLRDGLSSTAVSDLAGYDSPAYFSKIFKQTTGVTPTEYTNEG